MEQVGLNSNKAYAAPRNYWLNQAYSDDDAYATICHYPTANTRDRGPINFDRNRWFAANILKPNNILTPTMCNKK
jgi:hypothetical protein